MEKLMALVWSFPSCQQISWRTVKLQLNDSRIVRCSRQTAPPPLSAAPWQRQHGGVSTPRMLRQSLQEAGRRAATPQPLQAIQQQVQQQYQVSSELLLQKWAARYCDRLPETCSRLRRAGGYPVTHPLHLRVRNPLPGVEPGPLAQRCVGCRCRLLPCGLASQVTAGVRGQRESGMSRWCRGFAWQSTRCAAWKAHWKPSCSCSTISVQLHF